MEFEPSFNIDKVVTPLLMTKHGNGSAESGAYDTANVMAVVGAFALNRKPLEYLYLPNADHNVIRPLERIALIDAVVDWMTFWLQGYEDPNPSKAHIYLRWHQMREQQAESVRAARSKKDGS